MLRNEVLKLRFSFINIVFKHCSNNLFHSCFKSGRGVLFNGFHSQNGYYLQRFFSKNPKVDLSNQIVANVLKKWCQTFERNAISEPKESIQFIVCHHFKINRISDVYNKKWTEKVLTDVDVAKINEMCQQRLQSYPVQYIVEEWTFRNLILKMKPPVFIPRPETEQLVEIVKNDILLTGVKNIVEICCGSGAICLSLLQEIPNLLVLAIDKSEDACFLTIENAKKNNIKQGLTVIQHEVNLEKENVDIFAGKENYYDIIVSNPPYVPSKDMAGLQPEIILYEDLDALDGGHDGMNIIKPILRLSSSILRPGGRLYLEVDPSHPDIIKSLLNPNLDRTKEGEYDFDKFCDYRKLHLKTQNVHDDFNNKARFVEMIKI